MTAYLVIDQHVTRRAFAVAQNIPSGERQIPATFRQVLHRYAAGGQNDDIGPANVAGFDIGIKMHLDPKVPELACKPVNDALQAAPPACTDRKSELPAQLICRLVQCDLVAAQGQNPGRLKSSRPAADHNSTPWRWRCIDLVRQVRLAAGRGVMHTQCIETAIRPVQTIASANARPDPVLFTAQQLGNNMRVSDMGPGHAGKVHRPGFNSPIGGGESVEPRSLHRDQATDLANAAGECQIRARFCLHPRKGNIHALGGARIGAVDIQKIGNTVLTQKAANFDAFLGRNSALIGLISRVTHTNPEICRDRASDGLQNRC